MKPKKDAEVIMAWATGKIVQRRTPGGKWRDVLEKNPIWHDHCEHRIKPPRQDETRMTDTELWEKYRLCVQESKGGYGLPEDLRLFANYAIQRSIADGDVQIVDTAPKQE